MDVCVCDAGALLEDPRDGSRNVQIEGVNVSHTPSFEGMQPSDPCMCSGAGGDSL